MKTLEVFYYSMNSYFLSLSMDKYLKSYASVEVNQGDIYVCVCVFGLLFSCSCPLFLILRLQIKRLHIKISNVEMEIVSTVFIFTDSAIYFENSVRFVSLKSPFDKFLMTASS